MLAILSFLVANLARQWAYSEADDFEAAYLIGEETLAMAVPMKLEPLGD